jgi:6-phosphogluconate dehydrogenase
MNIGLIGLGKMGMMLLAQMQEQGFLVEALDKNLTLKDEVETLGGFFHETLESLVGALKKPRTLWLMLPAGEVTESVYQAVLPLLSEGDAVLDGGNAHYEDSRRRAQAAKDRGLSYLDVGTSGGMEGARHGACMMVGGEKEAFLRLEPLFQALCVEKGYLHCGAAGSGHFLKMVHNGIEYGMMQAIGEGFNLLHHSPYPYALEDVARVFNHGSVIRSWLMELTEGVLRGSVNLEAVEGVIPSSGEGRWTVEEALKLQVPLPVITQSVMVRYASEDREKYGEKVVASLRNAFGGHTVPQKEEP